MHLLEHARRAAVARAAWRLTSAFVAAALAACSTGAPSSAADPQRLQAFAARGYTALAPGAAHSTGHDWLLAGQPHHLVLLQPSGAKAAPLIVYLPGLGERADAGQRWRQAWAEAGYAVLSLQPLAEDAGAWQSDLARVGEFKALGQRQYGAAAMTRRLRALIEVLEEAQRRGQSGDAAWQAIDWRRVAVAGFDLGAYSALALAGEQIRGAEVGTGRVTLRAAIALSPYANISEGAMDTRYQALRSPVLSITSDIDADPLGLVSGPALRLAPFEGMPGPDKYLLSLQGLAHARLSGSAALPGEVSARSQPLRASDGSAEGADDAILRPPPGGSGGGSQRRRGGSTPAEAARAAPTRERPGAADTGQSETALQLRQLAVQGISIAFLDAYLKDDLPAREWLQTDARRWLAPAGELRHK